MRSTLLFFSLIALLINGPRSFSQSWYPLGPDVREEAGYGWQGKWSGGSADFFVINDSVYVGLGDRSKAIIRKFNGQAWENFVTPFKLNTPENPSSNPFFPKIVISRNKTVFVAYPDTSFMSPIGYKGSIKSFDGNSWVPVGPGGFTNVAVKSIDMKFGKSDSLFVLISDLNDGISVMKFNGSTWDTLGNMGFINSTTAKLEIDTNGVPHICYADPNNLNRIKVQKFSGNNWTTISPASGLSTLIFSNPNMNFHPLNEQPGFHYHNRLSTTESSRKLQ